MRDPETKRRVAAWFGQWQAPLRKFLIGKTALPVADLDDVAQEVFLRLLRYERSVLVEHPQAYLFKMASNIAAEWSIRARLRHPHNDQWIETLASDNEPEVRAARDLAQDEIERALNTLTPRQREVLKLQFAEGLGHKEIAERLDITPRSVKRAISKSYARLRRELTPDLLEPLSHGRE
jgi:RNA polymerase sigma-70 factor (ECF subfamily)